MNKRWDYYSLVFLVIYAMLQLIRWQIMPQFMDMYYHLLTAGSFLRLGGYSGWDFWQYAPLGRTNIYPPFFHVMLALFMKAGINAVILAKVCESIVPVMFLLTLWRFVRSNFGPRCAFFTVLAAVSSFSFQLSLINHIPATLALILGLFAAQYLLKGRFVRAGFALALCFYMHIGVSWMFLAGFLFYGAFNKDARDSSLRVVTVAFLTALPIILKQAGDLKYVTAFGFQLAEKDICQFKPFDYMLALCGLGVVLRRKKEYSLALGLLAGSLVFAVYPYRLFSAEGYIPVIILAAIFIDDIWQRQGKVWFFKGFAIVSLLVFLVVSPTLALEREEGMLHSQVKFKFFDSAFLGMLLARGDTIWVPNDHLPAAKMIRDNSGQEEIIYSTLNIEGIILAGLASRPTANALLPEIKSSQSFDPFANSRVIIFNRLDPSGFVSKVSSAYGLKEIGTTKMFMLYRNPSPLGRAHLPKWYLPLLPLGVLFIIWLVVVILPGI